jgi:peptidoglycan-associated lipoprotein
MRAFIMFPLLIAGLVGCNTTPETDTEGREVTTVIETPGSTGTGDRTNVNVYPQAHDNGSQDQSWSDPNSPGGAGGRVLVYFGYDSVEIAPEYRDVIARAAQRAAKNPRLTAIIEGHCDQNGTREYNIALGERRALAVRQLMLLHGITPEQAQVISYGEEKPAALGSGEESDRQNRRVEISFIKAVGGY